MWIYKAHNVSKQAESEAPIQTKLNQPTYANLSVRVCHSSLHIYNMQINYHIHKLSKAPTSWEPWVRMQPQTI